MQDVQIKDAPINIFLKILPRLVRNAVIFAILVLQRILALLVVVESI